MDAFRDTSAMRDDARLGHTRSATIRSGCLVGVLLVLAACTPKPPPYESRAISTPSSTSQSTKSIGAAPVSTPAEASFIDEFDRPDTKNGLGEGWDLRHTPRGDVASLPPATDGYIAGGHFTYAGTSDVIAIRQFRAPVLAIGAEGQFSRRGNSTSESTIMMGIAGDENLKTDVVMFAASRTDWGLQSQNANSRLKIIATGQFSRPLELGRSYRFVLSCTGSQVSITGPGIDESRSLPMPVSPGVYGFWREDPSRTPASGIFDFDKVWALEDGLPAAPIPAPIADAEH